MHTYDLRPDEFKVEVDGRKAVVGDILPDFSTKDRIGIVVDRPFGALGASGLLLAGVMSYYDSLRSQGLAAPAYPDFFLFHVGTPWGDHSMLDVWPTSKEVLVANNPTALLEAISDRAISVLVVPEREGVAPQFGAEQVFSLTHSVRLGFVYGPGGAASAADVTIRSGPRIQEWVRAALDPKTAAAAARREGEEHFPYAAAIDRRAGEVGEPVRRKLQTERDELADDGWVRESYRRAELSEALAIIAAI